MGAFRYIIILLLVVYIVQCSARKKTRNKNKDSVDGESRNKNKDSIDGEPFTKIKDSVDGNATTVDNSVDGNTTTVDNSVDGNATSVDNSVDGNATTTVDNRESRQIFGAPIFISVQRCSTPKVPYSNKCGMCAECPGELCKRFNVRTCKCHRRFRCNSRHKTK